MFRELYLREDRRKDPESFSMDGPKLGLPSMKISFILVELKDMSFSSTKMNEILMAGRRN
jgi:hypothetical protein